jgi:methylmalonyl-CoA/ethylmalonyl-CoA epimerase
VIASDFVFHHLGVAVHALEKEIPLYRELFGYELTSGPFEDPIQNVSVCFLSRGKADMVIELVAPLGIESPVHRTLIRGATAYHICYEVPNVDAAISHLAEQGSFLLSGPVPAVAFNFRAIAWLMTRTNLLVELLQR